LSKIACRSLKPLLLDSVCHQLLFGTLWADDVLPVRDEALAHHAALAGGADETVVVPVTTLERNETGSTNPCDGLATGSAPLGEQLPEAVSAVRLVITRGEPLPCQGLLAVRAGEALPVPGVVTVGHPSLGDYLATLDALGSKLFFIALGTVDIVLLGYEGLCADGVLAGAAHEALLVPLPGLVLHLLHSCFENISTPVTPGGELCIVARTAVDSVSLGAELLVHQAGPALVAQEAGLVPVLLLVRQILGVNPDNFTTFIAIVCKHIFITFYTVRMVVSQDIPVASQAIIAVMTEHCLFLMIVRPVLRLTKIFYS